MPNLNVFTYLVRCQISAKTFASWPCHAFWALYIMLCTLHPTTKCTQNKCSYGEQIKTFASSPNPFRRVFQLHITSAYAANKKICQFAKPVLLRIPSPLLILLRAYLHIKGKGLVWLCCQWILIAVCWNHAPPWQNCRVWWIQHIVLAHRYHMMSTLYPYIL